MADPGRASAPPPPPPLIFRPNWGSKGRKKLKVFRTRKWPIFLGSNRLKASTDHYGVEAAFLSDACQPEVDFLNSSVVILIKFLGKSSL